MALSIRSITAATRPTATTCVFAVFSDESVEKHPCFRALGAAQRRYLAAFSKRAFTNERNEVDYVVFPSGKPAAAFLFGLGKHSEWSRRRFALAMRRLVSMAESQKIASLTVHLPSLTITDVAETELLQHAAENLLLADYRFGRYQRPAKKKHALRLVELVVSANRGAAKALAIGKTIAQFTNQCRDLANTPGSDMTPSLLAQKAKTLADETGCTLRVLGRDAMAKEKMGAILGVARGSVEEPKFIILEHRGGQKTEPPLVFVGKGVTFDSGGINLKSSSGMSDMHMDMSGGAAALCAVAAIAALKLPIRAIALVPAVENMPSGSGYRPGDVLTSRSGTTIEIGDTDAEGRVILADALDYAKDYKPAVIIDLATLTGAAAVALGQHRTALFSNRDAFAEELLQLGKRSGDDCWRMPMGEEYEAEIKGSFADINNIGKTRYGGAIHGAVFLQHFVGSAPWAHLDIAPTMTTADGQYLAKGASGVGVRLLVALAKTRAEKLKVKG